MSLDRAQNIMTHANFDVAKRLLEVIKIDQMVTMMARQMMAQKVVSIQQKSEGADPEELKQVTDAFQQAFMLHVPDLMEEVIKAYAGAFSVEDMEAVIAFNKSEIGQRFEAGQAQIQQKTQALFKDWSSHAARAAFDKASAQVAAEE
ncbi:DUF2059 domain-containing protein [Eilatimonas milleporae]|uniref:Uncharacterized protein DUF2059 n=1 Tax=Eilatimonas milleporae TaxID=911205 RepID=A0A3M0CFY5_9PROT|nr:DUF2059 domain-containing protein [Eilatimonas milleporae]RMB08494.1 uncharacterized protein DUF2059 [Eilatimonas milleporae]